jgi:hypothetical protein
MRTYRVPYTVCPGTGHKAARIVAEARTETDATGAVLAVKSYPLGECPKCHRTDVSASLEGTMRRHKAGA